MGTAENSNRLEYLRKVFSEKAVYTSAENSALYSPSGERCAFLVDSRQVTLTPEVLSVIAELFWSLHPDEDDVQIAGLEIGAIPIVTAIVMMGAELGKRPTGLVVRKSKKKYGRQRSIEGNPRMGIPVIVVDDLFNSGSSFEKCRSALCEMHLEVKSYFALIDFHSLAGIEWRKRGFKVVAPLALSDISKQKVSTPKKPLVPFSRFEIDWIYRGPGAANQNLIISRANPVMADDHVLLGCSTGYIHSVDIKTGQPSWSYDFRGRNSKQIAATPGLFRDSLIIGGYNGDLVRLDIKLGIPIWRASVADFIGSSLVVDEQRGRFFVGLENNLEGRKGAMACYDVESCDLIWCHELLEYQHGSPVYIREKEWVAFGTNCGSFCVLDAITGSLVYRQGIDGQVKQAPVWSPELRRVVFTTTSGKTYSIDLEKLCQDYVFDNQVCNYASPLIVGRFAFVTSPDQYFYCYDLVEKRLVRHFHAGSRIFSAPTFADGSIFFGNNGGQVHEVHPLVFVSRGILQLPDRVLSEIVFSARHQKFLAHLGDGGLVCFSRSEEVYGSGEK